MKRHSFLVTVFAVVLFSSCKKKDNPVPVNAEMNYVNLSDRVVAYQQGAVHLDINNDNEVDLHFSVWLVGDPVLEQDKRQFRVSSGIHTRLAVHVNEETPVMEKGETVFLSSFNGYSWYEASSIILVQRIEEISGNVFWTGNWKTANKKYLPFQLLKNNQRYNGWIELTVDMVQEKIILHKAAYSKLPEKDIRAGF
jgi:hypothetical protein